MKIIYPLVASVSMLLAGCATAAIPSMNDLTNCVSASQNYIINNFTGPTNGTTKAAVTNIVFPIVQSATNNALATATNSFMPIGTAIPTTNGFVTASITNGLATTNYVNTATNGFVTQSITNGLASTNWVISYADTNGAAIAAAFNATNGFVSGGGTTLLQVSNVATAFTNNFGTTIPVNMTNGLNVFYAYETIYPFNHLNPSTNYWGLENIDAKNFVISQVSAGNSYYADFTNDDAGYVGLYAAANATKGAIDFPFGATSSNSPLANLSMVTNVATSVGGSATNAIANNNGVGTNLTVYGTMTSTNIIATIVGGSHIWTLPNEFSNNVQFDVAPNFQTPIVVTVTNSTYYGTHYGNGAGLTNVPGIGVTTNQFASTNYVNTATNGFVTASVTNGLATTNYVNNAVTNGLIYGVGTVTNSGTLYLSGILTNPAVLVSANYPILITGTTNGLATTNFVNTTVQAATNGLTGGGITLLQATNVAAALTNQLAIPTTNQFITLLNATNVAASLTNGFITLVGATNVAAALTNGFIGLTQATNVAASLTNGHITLLQATNVAAALTNQLVIPTTNQFVSTNNTTWFDTNGAALAATNNSWAAAKNAFVASAGHGVTPTFSTNFGAYLPNSIQFPGWTNTPPGAGISNVTVVIESWSDDTRGAIRVYAGPGTVQQSSYANLGVLSLASNYPITGTWIFTYGGSSNIVMTSHIVPLGVSDQTTSNILIRSGSAMTANTMVRDYYLHIQ